MLGTPTLVWAHHTKALVEIKRAMYFRGVFVAAWLECNRRSGALAERI